MSHNFEYAMKIQNRYGTKNKRESEQYKINRAVSRHFEDTIDCQDVLLNNQPFQLMIIRDANNTYKKKIKSRPGDYFNIGDIVTWGKQKWLINSLDTDDKSHLSGNMWLCTILLKWQDTNGDILERWCFDENLTKYSSGITPGKIVTTGDFQYGLQLTLDEKTKYLKRDKRFIIDEDDIEEPNVYKITNREVKTTNYDYFGRGKLLNLTLSFDFFNAVNDRPDLGVCDYKEPLTLSLPSEDNESSVLCSINYSGNPTIKLGGRTKVFTGVFLDQEGNEVSLAYKWETQISENIKQYVIIQEDSSSLSISAPNNVDLLGEVITLSFFDEENKYSSSIDVTIVSGV